MCGAVALLLPVRGDCFDCRCNNDVEIEPCQIIQGLTSHEVSLTITGRKYWEKKITFQQVKQEQLLDVRFHTILHTMTR